MLNPTIKTTKKISKSFSPDYGLREDWRMRIRNSVVFYEGEPFFVEEVNFDKSKDFSAIRSTLVNRHSLASSQKEREEIVREIDKHDEMVANYKGSLLAYGSVLRSSKKDSRPKPTSVPVEELDLSLQPIGYVNSTTGNKLNRGHTCAYVSRMPYNQTKQGISDQNIRYFYPPNSPNLGNLGVGSWEFTATLKNEYPTADECLEMLFKLEGLNSAAFSREFSFRVDEVGNTTLYHRDRYVGVYDSEESSVSLLSKYEYLREPLTEIGLNVLKPFNGD